MIVTEAKQLEAILFFFASLEVNSFWLIASMLANQRTLKVLFTLWYILINK